VSVSTRITIVDDGRVVLDEEVSAYQINTWTPQGHGDPWGFKVTASNGNIPAHEEIQLPASVDGITSTTQHRLEDEAGEAIAEFLAQELEQGDQ